MPPHRHVPGVSPTKLLAAALGLALLAPSLLWPPLARAAKPHPLFGRSLLGNSAEAFLFSPTTGATADYVVRVFDYDSTTSAALVPEPVVDITGGESDADVSRSQLDVVFGDFDGDHRDEPFIMRSVNEGTPGQRTMRLGWSLTSTQLDWWPINDFGAGIAYSQQGTSRSSACARLAAGDLDSDGRDELVTVVRTPSGFLEINLWRLDDQSQMYFVATELGELISTDLGESGKFDATCGDVDGDGQDELVVGGVRRIQGSSTNVQLFATVYRLVAGDLVPMVTSTSQSVNIARDEWGEDQQVDRIALTTGTLRSTLREQILFSWDVRRGYWVSTGWHPLICPFTDTYDFRREMTARVAVLDVNAGGTPWTISGWYTGRVSTSLTSNMVTNHCSPTDLGYTESGPSLGIAAADLSGDGIDEVVLAATNKLIVYQMGAGDSLENVLEVARSAPYTDPSRRVVAIADLDVNPDGPQRWVPEVVLMDWSAPATGPRLRVFRPVVNGAGTVTGLTTLCTYQQSGLPRVNAEYAIAVGDLDGDAVRLGDPAYARTVSVAQPRVLLKTPPVHFDVFGGTSYDIAGCYDGSGSYLCDCFQASYSKQTGTTFAVRTETMTDWGASASLKAGYEGLSVSVEASLEASYGQNMSRAGEVTTSYTVEQQVTTAGVDRILADEVCYDVWEYPVYAPGAQGPRTLRGHVAVVRPVEVSQPRWFTFTTWPTSHHPLGHEAGNILSYPRYGLPSQDPNIAEIWKSDRWDVATAAPGLGPLADCPFGFGVTWEDIVSQSLASSWTAGVEMGASVGAYGVSVGLSGHYSQEELSTRQTTVGEGLQIAVTLGSASGAAEAPYTVQPYVYRGLDGTLVCDYTVEPGYGNPGNPTWWDTHYTSAPDLAFVLPKRYNAEKGLPVEDPRTRNRTPSVWVSPDTATVGDTVTVFATVHNFSLAPLGSPVPVRFTIGDPDSATHTHIVGLWGEEQVTTPAAMAPRDTATVRMQWVIPGAISAVPWIFAEVDPAAAVGELHEDNNKGYTTMKVSGGSSVGVTSTIVPTAYRLFPAVPNPFRGRTTLTFDLPVAGHTSLMVYDIAGRRVATLANGVLSAGRHELAWDGRAENGASAPAGVYFCRLRSETFAESRRLLFLR